MVENKDKIGVLVGLFLLIMLGLIFANILNDQVSETNTIRTSTNASIPLTATSGLLGNTNLRSLGNIITSGLIVNNFTNNTISSNNYNVNTNGSIWLNAGASDIRAQGTAPILNVTYTYYAEQYVKGDSISRTLVNLIGLFFVLGVFLLVLWKSGVIDMDNLLGK